MKSDSSSPVAGVVVQDYRLMVATVTWKTGERRSIATFSPADLVTLGVLVNRGATVAEIEKQFAGKLVAEPKTPADVLRVMTERSEN